MTEKQVPSVATFPEGHWYYATVGTNRSWISPREEEYVEWLNKFEKMLRLKLVEIERTLDRLQYRGSNPMMWIEGQAQKKLLEELLGSAESQKKGLEELEK